MRGYILGFIVWVIYKILYSTWRITYIESEEMLSRLKNKEPFVIAHWHGDELALIHVVKKYRLSAIASQSDDGQIVNTVLKLLGTKTSRGSSTRGGVGALKGLLALTKEGYNCSVAIDGPKGPIYKAKPGVFEMSRLLKAPIFYSGVYCSDKIVFEKSWNKAYLPKPFAKIIIYWGGPIGPITREDDPRDPQLAENLEGLMRGAKKKAAESIG